ncbi:hypothetical protein CEV32_3190 [Brucella rhizosphaerae]|uniref:Uncharacterized protein n=1 Tax=Brucella rhizosphaerae TaxID=571254 RepID=A0A256FUK2_9HYPH|nr:hypothetical protein CEV32_3190 [Brucella rhizosphaerae]
MAEQTISLINTTLVTMLVPHHQIFERMIMRRVRGTGL